MRSWPVSPLSTVLTVALLLGSASPVFAQRAVPSADASAAGALFRDGREAMKREQYALACTKFEQSARLAAAPGTFLNLAACREKMGRFSAALKALEEARALLPAGDERGPYVRDQIAAIEPRVPSLIIRLAVSDAESARVRLDGEELARTALRRPIRVDVGRHEIVVSSPGHEDGRYTVNAMEGVTQTLSLRPGPPRDAAPSSSSPPARAPSAAQDERGPGPSSARRTGAYVALGAGGLGIVVGSVAAVLVLNKKSQMEGNCNEDFECNPQGLDAASAGETFSTISAISYAVGAVGIGVGAYLLLTEDGSDGSSAALGVAPLTQGAAITACGRF